MSTRTQDAKHQPLSKVDRLRQDAEQASRVRRLTTHPDVVALRTEAIRSQVDALMWVGLLLGLAFTMVNVQQFAAEGAHAGTLPWIAAWLLDPMVSLVLIAVLRAEQITARYQVKTGPWVRRTKRFAFAATFVMNTWTSFAEMDLAGIVLHSVPPLLVYCAAETGPVLRDRLTEAVLRAEQAATMNAPMPVHDPTSEPTVNPAEGRPVNTSAPVHGGTGEHPARDGGERAGRRSRTSNGKPARRPRKLLADYVAEARAAYRPGDVVTPAWVRQVVPDCARGTSKNVADTLNAELTPPPPTSAAPEAESGADGRAA